MKKATHLKTSVTRMLAALERFEMDHSRKKEKFEIVDGIHGNLKVSLQWHASKQRMFLFLEI